MKNLIEKALESSFDYSGYRKHIDELYDRGETTSGDTSDAMLHYTDLNRSRMNKWDKRYHPSEEVLNAVKSLDTPEIWLVLTEGWCGDAAQSLPLLVKMAEANDNIQIKMALRDQNTDLMDHFLTNGGRAIPKLIRINAETLEVINDWGARPAIAQEMVVSAKAAGEDYATPLHLWYAKNKGAEMEREMVELLLGVGSEA